MCKRPRLLRMTMRLWTWNLKRRESKAALSCVVCGIQGEGGSTDPSRCSGTPLPQALQPHRARPALNWHGDAPDIAQVTCPGPYMEGAKEKSYACKGEKEKQTLPTAGSRRMGTRIPSKSTSPIKIDPQIAARRRLANTLLLHAVDQLDIDH